MSDQRLLSHADDPRLHRVLEVLGIKSAQDTKQLLVEHPDFANALEALLAAHDRMQSTADLSTKMGPDSSTFDASPCNVDDRTMSLREVPDSTNDSHALHNSLPSATKHRVFGEYELLGEIARGGMGVVYKARQTKLNRIVALKMILDGQLASEQDVKRFYAEAEAAAQLDHPGIVPIFEVGQHDGHHYFSMAFVEGGSLADKLKVGPMPPRDAAEYIKNVAEAVAYAHDKRVIHRDLKPGNVLLDVHGTPKVTDFGLAKRIEGDSGLTVTGQILGTPSYMPPEQAAGNHHQVKETADVYALSAVLYAMLTGRPPFQAANPIETLKQVFEQEPLAPRQLNPSIPSDLETICLKGMRKEVRSRYASATAFAADIQRWLDGRPIEARRVGRLEQCSKWCQLNPFPTAALATMPFLMDGLNGMALFVASLSLALYVPIGRLFRLRLVLLILLMSVAIIVFEVFISRDPILAIDVGLTSLLVVMVGILAGAYGQNLCVGLASAVGRSADLAQLVIIFSLMTAHLFWLADIWTHLKYLYRDVHGLLGRQDFSFSLIQLSFVFALPLVPLVMMRPSIPQIQDFARKNKLTACLGLVNLVLIAGFLLLTLVWAIVALTI